MKEISLSISGVSAAVIGLFLAGVGIGVYYDSTLKPSSSIDEQAQYQRCSDLLERRTKEQQDSTTSRLEQAVVIGATNSQEAFRLLNNEVYAYARHTCAESPSKCTPEDKLMVAGRSCRQAVFRIVQEMSAYTISSETIFDATTILSNGYNCNEVNKRLPRNALDKITLKF